MVVRLQDLEMKLQIWDVSSLITGMELLEFSKDISIL